MTLRVPPLRTVLTEAEASTPARAGTSAWSAAVRVAGLVGLAMLAGACRQGPDHSPTTTLPVGAPSGQPRFFADGEALGLSWVEREGEVARLLFARREGGRWSEPVEAARGRDWFVNWADTPGVVPAGDGAYLAFYLQKTGEGAYDYAIRTTRSDDGGRTWSMPVTPHTEAVAAEFGFVSAHPEAGGVRLVWLDGEATASGTAAQAHGPMALRTAVLLPDGTKADGALLDDRVCECCPTAMARATSGLVVAYRDRSAEEVRDIAVVRKGGEGWSAPAIPHPDGWRIDGCPVNGPALAAEGDRIALAWYTGAGGSRVRLAVSEDGGQTFGAVLEVDAESVVGRVDVRWARGEPLVSWMVREGEGAALYLRWGAAEPYRVAALGAERASGIPRLAVLADTAWVAWVDGEGPRVRVEPVPLAAMARSLTASAAPSSEASGP